MAIYVKNITIPIGSDYVEVFPPIKISGSNIPFNLTGYSARASLKKHPQSLNITANFTVGIVNHTEGILQLGLGAPVNSYLTPGRYVYDVLVGVGTTQKRVYEGSAILTAGITTSAFN